MPGLPAISVNIATAASVSWSVVSCSRPAHLAVAEGDGRRGEAGKLPRPPLQCRPAPRLPPHLLAGAEGCGGVRGGAAARGEGSGAVPAGRTVQWPAVNLAVLQHS